MSTRHSAALEADERVCKHMAAVENTTDDGRLDAFHSEDETEPDDCDREGLNGFPCWPCVRTGRKELPN